MYWNLRCTAVLTVHHISKGAKMPEQYNHSLKDNNNNNSKINRAATLCNDL